MLIDASGLLTRVLLLQDGLDGNSHEVGPNGPGAGDLFLTDWLLRL